MSEQGSNVEVTPRLKVFICHASEDKLMVRKLSDDLERDGIDPWLDDKNLLLGQDWKVEIAKAVRESHVVLVCLTPRSVDKEGYVQKEITLALDEADKKPEGTIYIIALRLENCVIPERLRRWQYGDLFEPKGYRKLLLALDYRARQVHVAAPRQVIGPEEALGLVWSVSASPAQVRHEGLSELVGDIEIVPPKGRQLSPQGKAELFDVWVGFTTTVTSPLLGRDYSSASLLIEHMRTGADGARCTTARFQARKRSDAVLVFENVPVADCDDGEFQVLRITGIRVNVAGLLIGAPVAASVKVEPRTPGIGVPVLTDPMVHVSVGA